MKRSSKKNDEPYRDVLHALELVALQLELLKAAPEEAMPLVARAREIARRLEFWMESGDRRFVYWIERRGRGTFLQATPIDVSQILDEKLFDAVDSVVLTSATLAVAGEFEFTKERLGLRNARTLVVPSHFDYREAGAAVRAAIAARPAQPGLHRGGGARNHRTADAQPRPRVRAVHQLSADAADLRSRLARSSLSDAAARHRPAQRAARGISRHAQRRAVRDFVVLAGRGCAGRAVELRYYR